MHTKLLLFVLLVASHYGFGQRETDNWLFGFSAGLNFAQSEPRPLKDNGLMAIQGTAAISDKDTGELLFYTDGRNFWSSNHQLMPSSSNPYGCATRITQSAIIIPDSGVDYLYHIFCIQPIPEATLDIDPICLYTREEVISDGLGLIYYQVDMRLNEGWGDVVAAQTTTLRSDVTEKLTAVKHRNNEDYWILTHGWNNNNFYAYQLTPTGILPPVVTSIGSVHGSHDFTTFIYQELSGEMKASPDGTKIACAVGLEERPFDLFDFDASTGRLSDYRNLGNVFGQYGVSFSPDNSKLYVSSDGKEPNNSDRSIILQFDLEAGTWDDVINSRMSIISQNTATNIPPYGIFDGFNTVMKGMALAADGRLYVCGNSDLDEEAAIRPHVLVVIDKPNEKGFACSVNQREFNFGKGRAAIGLPNFMQHYFNNLESSTVCKTNTALEVFPNPTTDFLNIRMIDGCRPEVTFNLFNTLGQRILSDRTGNQLDLRDLSAGVYILITQSHYNQRMATKIIKL